MLSRVTKKNSLEANNLIPKMGNYCEYALVYKLVEYTCNYVEIISYKR